MEAVSIYRRKTPEELLLSISKLHRGRLKIIIGAVNGSGKTYHMLQEGRQLKEQGRDVVISAVTTLGRPETVRQTASFERVPSIRWMKGDSERKDLDLETLLERNPEVVLVDGLAHVNRPGASHRTRLEDIMYLMDSGISVITTVNVYELDGADEIAQKWTGIQAEETVPANTLELADEVRLIDVSPETMLKRLEEGVLGTQHPAISRRGNLGVLRELSLRLVAEGVNETLEKHREEQGLEGASGATERILVSAQYHWNGSLYVRRGQQVAKRLNGDLSVIAFINPKRALSADELTFKRSIVKLVDKVEGRFEELPFVSRRKLPSVIARYAVEHKATRIVMGHSKQGRWQQLWQGSLADGVLRSISGVDLLLIADRAEHDGERILPVKHRKNEKHDLFRRLNAEERERKAKSFSRGNLKVYIGASPGVGKTYKMLQEGNALFDKGIDAAIGLLETHGRKETADQIGRLPIIPRNRIEYGGAKLEEMDTEAIIRRNPEVVLVDELAHTNVPGSARKKRYEDVLRLLEHGISVITTVNVQHLESLNDAVEGLTGVRVRETVPDALLRLADEVELIDVTPQMLQQRMREGKIYALAKVEQALSAFFTTGNLIALRELALREIADDVDERLEAWNYNRTLRGPLYRREVIFIGVDIRSGASERLIRRGFRLAYRLKAEWHVHYVSDGNPLGEALENKQLSLIALTERLGGTFHSSAAAGRNGIADRLLVEAKEVKATQLIIGQSDKSLLQLLWQGHIVRRILRMGRHMDVLIAADKQ
ncbi:histidine kinase [Paenibacillus sp. NEAU-GSW1]|uniref:histidine kinase n=1 Tax=Paenibacillus sp. NEAU-GSW1 TaxID=2682486 RepID=UPI0012E1FEFA|nr:histidine kinase [Paenibacillus sp. NEAU-GSW1]MUT67142.1 histidine kinase [Paenibacillus sp. NEAU-GSW1]